jgi:DNA modification methylase
MRRDVAAGTWNGGNPDCEHMAVAAGGTHNRGRDRAASGGTFHDSPRVEQSLGIPYREKCGKCGAERADRQIGLEPSPAEYVESLRGVFAGVRRVLADDGVLWLNLGDSYSTGTGNRNEGLNERWGNAPGARKQEHDNQGRAPVVGIPAKNLLGIPWRVAFALQDDGWTLRAEVIWAKRNCMPEAVTDRPSRTHEQIFLFSKSRRYWYDADAIRENSDLEQEAHNQRYAREYEAHSARVSTTGQPGNQNNKGIHSRPGRPGRNARSVWTISAQPFPGAHFACFPPELPRRCILAGTREGDTVLDPFAGSGTTLRVARQLGRKAIGIELNPEYIGIIRDRIGQSTLEFGEATA